MAVRRLASAFVEILSQRGSSLSFENLYNQAYTLVLKKKGDQVSTLARLVMRAASMLHERDGQLASQMISDILLYYTRFWCVKRRITPPMELYRQYVAERKAKALATLERRLPALVKERYLRPGGAFETETAKLPRWA